MDRAELGELMLAARKSAIQGQQANVLAAVDAALKEPHDPSTEGELFLIRAVVNQTEEDPNLSANDALAAVEATQVGARWSLRPAALAIAAEAVFRTGDAERSIELTVEAMVALAERQEETPDLDVIRAWNALGIMFWRLAAYELAFDSAKEAWLAAGALDESDARSIIAYNLCSLGLEHLRSYEGDDQGRDMLIREITDAVDYLCFEADSPQATEVIGPTMRVELALLGHGDPTVIDTFAAEAMTGVDLPPQIQAWYRLVRSMVMRRNGELTAAAQLLDTAFEGLQLPAAEEHNLLRALRQRAEVRQLTGDLTGACEDLTGIVERVHRLQRQQVGQLSMQIRRRAESELARARVRREVALEMSIDQVTGVGTRRWLERCLEELTKTATSGAVVMFDLDRFKAINDTFGHAAGDRVLEQVGAVLKTTVRDGDIVARYGGEEFVAILPDAPITVGRTLAERIRTELGRVDWTDMAGDMAITVSAGVAAGSFGRPWDLIEQADQHLYQAKRAGRDQVVTDTAG